MDLRIEKTKRAIRNAFLELRSKKPVEKITVKELAALACINKSTFYSHYEDIFALSEELESETVASVLLEISKRQQDPFRDPEIFTRNLYMALLSHNTLINLIFSGREKTCLGDRLETEMKRLVWEKYPEYEKNQKASVILSFCIQGSYHAYLNNQDVPPEILIEVSETAVRLLKPVYQGDGITDNTIDG